ncbi:MAG TPA: LarC family nickel insertion protein, partial [Candidatus Limnocylindria bacterium]|nr:LarC family nickel insertion protein [Candidatus Limnocylindria bacterium]
MRAVHFDCPSGASGDMILGALVDVGAGIDELRTELHKLALPGWRISAREVRRGAFRATKVDVEVDPAAHHHHRHLGDIVAILRASTLAGPVRAQAERIFTRLADAEARVHGSGREEVHFHEVGAVDAIIDVTGAAVALALLGAESVSASALPIGGGFVQGAHGRIAVPAPGTAELLRGFPVVDTGVAAELVTPTGAAIITTLA